MGVRKVLQRMILEGEKEMSVKKWGGGVYEAKGMAGERPGTLQEGKW